jgi:hypothetical protein
LSLGRDPRVGHNSRLHGFHRVTRR